MWQYYIKKKHPTSEITAYIILLHSYFHILLISNINFSCCSRKLKESPINQINMNQLTHSHALKCHDLVDFTTARKV